MHELSIAESLVRVVTEALDAQGGGRVLEVRLRVGALSGVEPEALRFCYEIAAADTPLAGSRLEIEAVPVVVHCPRCDRDVALSGPLRLRCPACDGPTDRIVGGKELEVDSVVLDDAAPEAGDSP